MSSADAQMLVPSGVKGGAYGKDVKEPAQMRQKTANEMTEENDLVNDPIQAEHSEAMPELAFLETWAYRCWCYDEHRQDTVTLAIFKHQVRHSTNLEFSVRINEQRQ